MKYFPIIAGLLGTSLFIVMVYKIARPTNDEPQNLTVCPNFEQKANFSDSEELLNVQNDIMDKLWKNPFPVLPPLAKKFKKEILKLSRSEEQHQKTAAFATSEWIWAYLPHIGTTKTINLCSYAQIVNATVAFLETNYCEFMFKAIEDVLEELQNAMILFRDVGLKKSECNPESYESIPLSKGISCYKNGLACEFDKMWNLLGSKYPPAYRIIVKELYQSDNYINRVIALIATSALSDQMGIIDTVFPQEPKFQLFFSSVTGSLPKPCCKQYIDEIGNLFIKMAPEAIKLVNIVKKSTGCPLA